MTLSAPRFISLLSTVGTLCLLTFSSVLFAQTQTQPKLVPATTVAPATIDPNNPIPVNTSSSIIQPAATGGAVAIPSSTNSSRSQKQLQNINTVSGGSNSAPNSTTQQMRQSLDNQQSTGMTLSFQVGKDSTKTAENETAIQPGQPVQIELNEGAFGNTAKTETAPAPGGGNVLLLTPEEQKKVVVSSPKAKAEETPAAQGAEQDNKPAFVAEEDTYQFGRVKQGSVVEYDIVFKNTGSVPLTLTDVKTSCGCTAPEWPKEAIAPGETSKISVKFNTAGKMGNQSKSITVFTNEAEPTNRHYFRIVGEVFNDTPPAEGGN